MSNFNRGKSGMQIIGYHRREQFHAENHVGDGGNHAGLYEQPRTLVRTNRHRFTVETRHYSQASYDYEAGQAL